MVEKSTYTHHTGWSWKITKELRWSRTGTKVSAMSAYINCCEIAKKNNDARKKERFYYKQNQKILIGQLQI